MAPRWTCTPPCPVAVKRLTPPWSSRFTWAGWTSSTRSWPTRLAEAGYVAVVPDLFHRYTDEQLNGPRLERLNYLNDLDVIADMNAAVDFLVANPHVDSDRIGVTGFCMGGRVAWMMAASNQIFKATVPFYGGNIMNIWGNGTLRLPST